MAWLAKLDRRVARCPAPIRWPYRCLKWTLIALGTYLVIGSAYLEVHQGRVGIGIGTVTVTVLAVVFGIHNYFYPPPPA